MMGTIMHLERGRPDASASNAVALPPGCKGPACPAFALCQGRCEVKPTRR